MPNPTPTRRRKACVIGAGPNGLAAAIVLAQAGVDVEVFEAEPTIGGACRTMDLTLPGFHHDFGSAVHPMAAGSPFFSSLPLENYGLEWIYSPSALAHPLDDGTSVLLDRDLAATEAALGADGNAWRDLMQPFAARWPAFAADILGPIVHIPKHPFLLARFGRNAILSATTLARRQFRNPSARALFAGCAAHSFMALDQPLSAGFGMVLGITAHAVGWPIPRGGAQSIANALAAHLAKLGGRISTSRRIDSLDDLPACDLILCDITPRQLLALAPAGRLTETYRRNLSRFQYGPGVLKVDYALSAPIPWNSPECARAATVHLGGTLEEIAASESAMSSGLHSAKPFVLLSQPTFFDSTRAPEGKHIAWAYCHVPNASTETEARLTRVEAQTAGRIEAQTAGRIEDQIAGRIEDQIERFATGFRATILARHVSPPAMLEAMDANLIGGDISGGLTNLNQLLLRPTHRQYSTSAPDLYLCSSSTPPGGGVHGMCGFHAAYQALRHLEQCV